ncbi:MAG: PEP-utilizing enzyme, partial [Candidatus Paceibacterota bacterium]
YGTGESVQIWENKEAIQWYRDRLLEENKKGTAFIDAVIAEYKPLLARIEKYWKDGPIILADELTKYKNTLRSAQKLFSLWYYTVSDERTPAEVLREPLELRRTDMLFSRNDVFVKDCIKALGVTTELANLISPSEFPSIPSVDVLEERSAGTISIDGGDFILAPLGGFARKHPEYVFEGLFDSVADIKEVRGQVANRGKATGRVRIVKNKPQMQGVGRGDILVSPMTTPDFLPAMERAAAFVTDEGGITCHAAIVAREMKKPCVIGTKIATKVLKDGDMVEVDAEKGVVRILK